MRADLIIPIHQVIYNSLIDWIKKTDTVVMESGSFSFSLARQLKEKLGCEIYILDPRKLSIIHQSLKKTDKEDAFKLALMGQRFEKEELPLVHLPDENQEGYRNLLNEHEYWVKNRTRMINRLHGIFTRAGITDMRKTALKSNKQRPIMLDRLPDHFRASAQRIHESIELANRNVNQIETEIADILKENRKYTELAFSIPGVGPITIFVFLAYIGDGSQFETAHHLAAYIGLVPKVYISGDKVHYGRTVKGVRCVKRVLLQSSWALICMLKTGEKYRIADVDRILERKLCRYSLI